MTRCATIGTTTAGDASAASRRACLSRLRLIALLTLAGAAGLAAAQPAPGHRVFPATALRGELIVSAAPEVVLNGRPDRLAPGARLRGEDNLLVMSGAVAGQRLIVHYTREPATGLLLDLWVLNAIERQNRPWPTTPAEAQAWRFDPSSQLWTKP